MIKHPPHPGELLREDVLKASHLSVTEAAKRLGLSRVALSRVLHGHAALSPDLAIRLEQAGAGTARAWLMLQAQYDLAEALTHTQPPVQRLYEPEPLA
jgi:antitoxin HigA-1